MTAKRWTTAIRHGRQAYLDGIASTANPYAPNGPDFDNWQKGWQQQYQINSAARKSGAAVPTTVNSGGRPKGYSPGAKEVRCETCRWWVSPFAGRAICTGVGPSPLTHGQVAIPGPDGRPVAGAAADLMLIEGRVVAMAVWPTTKADDGCSLHKIRVVAKVVISPTADKVTE